MSPGYPAPRVSVTTIGSSLAWKTRSAAGTISKTNLEDGNRRPPFIFIMEKPK